MAAEDWAACPQVVRIELAAVDAQAPKPEAARIIVRRVRDERDETSAMLPTSLSRATGPTFRAIVSPSLAA
jgi:hypothetical protein